MKSHYFISSNISISCKILFLLRKIIFDKVTIPDTSCDYNWRATYIRGNTAIVSAKIEGIYNVLWGRCELKFPPTLEDEDEVETTGDSSDTSSPGDSTVE